MSELNPNHAMLNEVREQWQKFTALVVAKSGGHVVITLDDIRHMGEAGLFLTIQELADGIHLTLVDEATAHALARKEGGLPS